MAEWKEQVLYYKRKLEKGVSTEKTLQILQKLQKVPITVTLLQETGIGKAVNGLRKQDGEVGDRAKLIVSSWKQIVTQSSAPEPQPPKHDQHKYSEKEHRRKQTEPHESGYRNYNEKYASNHVQESPHEEEMVASEEEEDNEKHSSASEYAHEEANMSEQENGTNEYDAVEDDDDDGEEDDTNYISSKSSRSGSSRHHYESAHSSNHHSRNSHGLKESSKPVNKPKKEPMRLSESHGKYRDKDKYSHSLSKSSSSSSVRKHTSLEGTAKHSDAQKKIVPESNSHHKKDKSYPSQSSQETNNKKPTHSSHGDSKSPKSSKHAKTSTANTSKILKSSNTHDGFDNSMASFEDILGLNDAVKIKKKKPPTSSQSKLTSSGSTESSKKSSSHHNLPATQVSSSHNRKPAKEKGSKRSREEEKSFVDVVPPKPKAPPLEEVDILSTLPAIQPNYKPLPFREPDSPPNKKKALTQEDALSLMVSRKDRTMVYSGRRTNYLVEVPSLRESCMKVLIENIDALAQTGGVPYDILKPVLEKCTPNQLYNLEDYNPYLLESSDELWKVHCKRDFKCRYPDEDETWRELYLRLLDEREAKLKSITANISASMAKAVPVRQTKLAYVETVAKPPRDVARRQAKYGTGLPVSHPMKAGPPLKATPRPIAPAINAASVSVPVPPPAKIKPKVAPLMQKTLKFMKSRFRR